MGCRRRGRFTLKKGNKMFSQAEKLTAVFIATIIVMLVAGAGYKMTINRDCVQSAIHQNYPAESIKKICR